MQRRCRRNTPRSDQPRPPLLEQKQLSISKWSKNLLDRLPTYPLSLLLSCSHHCWFTLRLHFPLPSPDTRIRGTNGQKVLLYVQSRGKLSSGSPLSVTCQLDRWVLHREMMQKMCQRTDWQQCPGCGRGTWFWGCRWLLRRSGSWSCDCRCFHSLPVRSSQSCTFCFLFRRWFDRDHIRILAGTKSTSCAPAPR